MPTILTAAMLLVIQPLPAAHETLSLSQIRNDVRTAMRQHAAAKQGREQEAAVIRLTEIYKRTVSDPRLSSSQLLQKEKARLWGRLTHIKRELEKRLSYRGNGDEHAQLQLATVDDHRRGGGAAVSDYGPGLVALIERTIAPEFWDVNGGPGSIVYYRPLRVLVVRATEDIHERIGGVRGAR